METDDTGTIVMSLNPTSSNNLGGGGLDSINTNNV